MSTDLENRVSARKAEMIAEIIEHKKNCSRPGAADAVDRLRIRLSELAHIEKEGGARARTRFDEWMAK